jgi:integrase/recombinase XerD
MLEREGRQLINEVISTTGERELSLGEALTHYETIYMPSRNWAQKTRVNYRNDIADLLRFLEGQGKKDPCRVDLQDLEAYMAELDRRGHAGTTRRRKTSSIKSFFGFLKQYGYITNNVAERLTPPAREHKEPRVLSKREYQALLRACSHDTRDAAIIELLLQTGIRLSELARLTLDDIELPKRISRNPANTGSVFVHGKGRKERTITLNYKACKALKAWLNIRPDVDTNSLFVSKFLEPMSPRAYEYVVKKYLKEAGIKRASVHTLRHTFATHHVAKGTSLRTIQEALGHADLKTTSIYIQLARDAMNKELQEHAL